MDTCIIPGCPNPAPHRLSLRLRRPDTSAIFAPETHARICDAHAEGGLDAEIALRPRDDGQVRTTVTAEAPAASVSRTTPIVQSAHP